MNIEDNKEQKYIRRFPSGAVRSSSVGRIRPDWVSPYAIEEISKVLVDNENDFGSCNYMLGIPEEKCLESLQRHVLELQEAIIIKDDLQEARLIARSAGFNIVAMLHTMVLKEKGLYKEVFDKEELVTVEVAKKGANYINKDGKKSPENKEIYTVKGEYTTQDLGDSLYNPDIWTEPFPKPYDDKLGFNRKLIPYSNIPYDHTKLNKFDRIKNEFEEELMFTSDGYSLVNNDTDTWLIKWFSKWKRV